MPPPARYRRPRPDASRLAAFDVLRAVDERDAYSNLVLPGLLRDRRLDPAAAGLATELAYGTLRGRGTYDAVLTACVDRPLSAVDAPVLAVLRLGVHQLLAMRVPDHAAVSETVELARGVLGDGRAKFVNAVLRKVTAHNVDGWLERVAPAAADDPVGRLAIVHSHPPWVVRAVRDALDGDLDGTSAFLAADNRPARVSLVARPGRASVDELLAAGAAPGRWSPLAVSLEGGDPGAIAAVREGRAGVQDEGSQLVTLALAKAHLNGPDRRWLDLCAGPGGKAALLAGLAAERGAALVAVERSAHRARLVASALAGMRSGRAVVADGTVAAWPVRTFDRVLVDAPCSGLGALRRRPEARWRRTPDDLTALGALQRDLLRSALSSARPGGLVAYVTCSPHLAETRRVIDDVLAGRPDVERLDARPYLPGVPGLGDGPHVQLWPHVHGTDAMFLALLRPSAQ